ncbi:MAG: hypothetical protein K6U74_00910, partial [Firmicutes bacterium]|nr:hypothetical protein [Bacillota bacterium]
DYGVDWARASLWYGAAENLALWVHVGASRWLYRLGILNRIGTDRFLKAVDAPMAAFSKLLNLLRVRRR